MNPPNEVAPSSERQAPCDGEDGTAPTRLVLPSDLPVAPTVRAFALGAGVPLAANTRVASGVLTFDRARTNSRRASSAGALGHVARAVVDTHLFLGPSSVGGATSAYDGPSAEVLPETWARRAATPTNALSFFTLARAERGSAALASVERGPDWQEGAAFASSAGYVRYVGLVLHVAFDSSCKRDRFLTLAGSNAIDRIFPRHGDAILSRYLVQAKATIVGFAIALGPARAAETWLGETECATDRLDACRSLFDAFETMADDIAVPELPQTFTPTPEGNGGWYVDSAETQTLD